MPSCMVGSKSAEASSAYSFRMRKRDSLAYLLFAILNIATALRFLTDTTAGNNAAWDGVPLDDTWIHFVYARSLAEHEGLYYNPGIPEAGFTSPLWVVLLAIALKLSAPFGSDPVLVSKALAIVFAIIAAALAYHLVKSYTKSYLIGLFSGTIVALEPTFSFSKVSGMEVALFATMMLLSILLFSQQRLRAAGLALGLTILSRPEGYLLAGIMATVLFLSEFLRLGNKREKTVGLLRTMAHLLVPAALIVLPIILFYYSINGSPFPNTFHAKHPQLRLLNYDNLRAIWTGYLSHLSYFSGLAWLASFPLLALGMVTSLEGKRLLSFPLLLAPWALYHGLSMTLPLGSTQWNFFLRRYLDPAIPLLIVLLSIGLWKMGALLRVWLSRKARWQALATYVLATPLFLLFLAPIVVEGQSLWQTLPGEFSWNCRNVNDVNVHIGRWVKDNLPPDTLIAVGDAGAVRYFGHGTMFDLLGLNYHKALGQDDFEVMKELKVDYAIVFPSTAFDGWPYISRIHEVSIPYNTILGSGTMVVYKTDWSPRIADKHRWYQIETKGWELIDTLDVGDAADEVQHNYQVSEAKSSTPSQRLFKAGEGATISDEGEIHTGLESFIVKSRPGKDLLVGKRYDAIVRGTVRVYAGGALVGEWSFTPRNYQFGEDTFVVPGRFISGERTLLGFEFVPGSSIDINSFYYWFFAP